MSLYKLTQTIKNYTVNDLINETKVEFSTSQNAFQISLLERTKNVLGVGS